MQQQFRDVRARLTPLERLEPHQVVAVFANAFQQGRLSRVGLTHALRVMPRNRNPCHDNLHPMPTGRVLRKASARQYRAAPNAQVTVLNVTNLVPLLSFNVFDGLACHSVRGMISRASLVEMIATLRARVLSLTLELEKSLPEVAQIAVGQASTPAEKEKAGVVTNIFNQIVTGSVGSNVANGGFNAQLTIDTKAGDVTSLVRALKGGGIEEADANEFAEVIASEQPDGPNQPFGVKAKAWIGANIGKALDGTWKIGAAVATNVLTEAPKQYYGIKNT